MLYFKVVDPVRATYEIANFLQAIEQLTVTTLRNVIGSLDLERALTSREEINRHLSGVLDETTGRWGIKVTRVEIKAIEPPASIRDSMEKQMRAERDRRAAILTAEGHKQSQILTAEGEKQRPCCGPTVTGRPASCRPRARPRRSHRVRRDPRGQPGLEGAGLPVPAGAAADRGRPANKVWIIPTELTKALGAMASGFKAPEAAGHVAAPNGAVSQKSRSAPGR